MATCKDCGTKLGFFEGADGFCADCRVNNLRNNALVQAGDAFARDFERKERETQRKRDASIEAVMLTTETAPNLNITRRIEIVTAEVAYGMNIFKDLFAGVRDIVGGRSEAVQSTMRDARRTALYELKKEAHSVGANAVVGVDLDYVELSGSSNMVMLVASGTAVVIEDAGQ